MAVELAGSLGELMINGSGYIWDLIGNNASNVIALAAVAFTWYQATLTREHNRLSVRPHLQTHTDTTKNYDQPVAYISYKVELRNNGLGPAIKGWVVFLDGAEKSVPNVKAVEDLIKDLVPNTLKHVVRFLGKNEAMRASDSQVILELNLPILNEAESLHLEAQLGRLAIVIEYTSMYGEELPPLDTRK
jgi:hypothetical protein